MENKVPEILAPVGGRDAFFAALNSGADAVFLGLKQFNARARAENFSVDDLRELVPLAHQYGMKVLVTLNILIKSSELKNLIDVLTDLEDLEVDAVIVQDLGVASLIQQHFPSLRMHASTQLAIHNAAGVLKALDYGFKRVVLARELTALEIKKIKSIVAERNAELEAFCHGSLCYSYSGLCFFSGAEDARSGNRGECAYTCRKPYKVLNEPGHGFLFSMKDLNTVEDLHLLVDAGVDTLKIEGRKKDAQFVSTAVKLYRKRLNEIFGKDTLRDAAPLEARELGSSIEEDLNFSFHRGMTSFFLKGRYHENVIDLDNPTHKGLRVGTIIKVTDTSIRIVAEKPLEKYDGLRIDPQTTLYHALPQHGEEYQAQDEKLQERYDNDVMQFSLRDMSVNGRFTPEVHAGEIVDIFIPENFSPKIGDVVTKTRSADLKRRVDALLKVPSGSKLNPICYVDTTVNLIEKETSIEILVTAKKLGTTLIKKSKSFEKSMAKKPTTLQSDLHELFGIFGNVGIISKTCEVHAKEGWFIPKSLLKEFKREVTEALGIAYVQRMMQKKEKVWDLIEPKEEIYNHQVTPQFSIKIDRLDYLDAIEKVVAPISEIVFEPKRAFLPSLDAEEIASRLKLFSEKTRIKIRLAFPTVIRAWDEPLLKRWLQVCAEQGIYAFEVGNAGALELFDAWELPKTDLSSDFTLYALNSVASKFYEQQGIQKIALSIEDDHLNLENQLRYWNLKNAVPQVILFKDTPLFIAESCSLTALHNGCPTAAVCGYRTLHIENDEGERFYVAHENCKSIVYGEQPYSVSYQLDQFTQWGVKDFRIDFLTREYTADQISEIVKTCAAGGKMENSHPANFERSLL